MVTQKLEREDNSFIMRKSTRRLAKRIVAGMRKEGLTAEYLSRKDAVSTKSRNIVRYTLHQTDIVIYNKAKGTLVLNSGGYKTDMTKERINAVLLEFGAKAEIHRHQGKWILSEAGRIDRDFFDGITIQIHRKFQ